jgi:hypothetical protein
MLDLLENSKPVTYNVLRLSIRRRFGSDNCPSTFRKIWATFMRHRGMDSEVIDQAANKIAQKSRNLHTTWKTTIAEKTVNLNANALS